MNKYYITTPIFYVNASPHIGHAYTTLACDVIARFKRLDGYDVHFLTGTDEHGQKVEKSAYNDGISPQEFTDKVSVTFREMVKKLNISNDDFIRTTEARHKKTVLDIWNKLVASGNIYLDKYSGWYSVRDESFYNESELIDGKAPTGADVEWVEEESYFFKLSAWQEKLLQFYENNAEFILPQSRRNEVVSFVRSGLHDLSVSRTTFNWGIPIPGNEKHVMYVWLDALVNYLSAVDTKDLSKFWPCDVHMVGKDILRFHAVYWPAFLMAANIELPKRIFAHGWLVVSGEKMSKSLGNVITPDSLLEQFGLDYTRYFLIREMSYGNDSNFNLDLLTTRINAELCNNIGNLSQRTLSFIFKNCEGKLAASPNFTDIDEKLMQEAYAVIEKLRKDIDIQALQSAFEHVVRLGSLANEYIDIQAPWNLRKTDPERMEVVLYVLAEVIRVIAILLQAIVPDSAAKILDTLKVENRSFSTLNKEHALTYGTVINEPKAVFPRLQ